MSSLKSYDHSAAQEISTPSQNPKFIVAFTGARQWAPFCSETGQFTPHYFDIELLSHLRFTKWLPPFYPTKMLKALSSPTFMLRVNQSYSPCFDHHNNIYWIIKVMRLLVSGQCMHRQLLSLATLPLVHILH
jgi:hypothetical protein